MAGSDQMKSTRCSATGEVSCSLRVCYSPPTHAGAQSTFGRGLTWEFYTVSVLRRLDAERFGLLLKVQGFGVRV